LRQLFGIRSKETISYMKIAKIIFSDVDLTNKNANYSTRRIMDNDLTELMQELSSIGYCQLGNAIITRGTSQETSHTIFVPIVNSQNPEDRMYGSLFHQAMRAALTLAKLYGVGTLVAELPSWDEEKTIYNLRSWGILLKRAIKPPLDRKNMVNVIDSVSKEYPGIMIRMDYLP